jgi:dienelactone hydrolase
MRALFTIALIFLAGCNATTKEFTIKDVDDFQPKIVASFPPDFPHNVDVRADFGRAGFDQMQPIIPSFNGKGELIASWNPHPKGPANRPTIVMIHGGHGLNATNLTNALWAKQKLQANILVLDSYWSRGRNENWKTMNEFGANMRMLDLIAAGRFLKTKGVDPSKTYVWGDSQGGWTVLRSFTDEPFMRAEVGQYYAGGIAIYPNCIVRDAKYAPKLGPYFKPIVIITAGEDDATSTRECDVQAVFKTENALWTHFPTATHGFDVANRGVKGIPVEGPCGNALNVYNKFRVCRNDSYTKQMYQKVLEYVTK